MKAIRFTTIFLAIVLISFGTYAQDNIFETETTTHKTCSVSYGKYDSAAKKYVYFETKPDTFYIYTIDERVIKTPSNSYHTYKGAKDSLIVDTDTIKVAYEELEDAFGKKCKIVFTVKYLKNIPTASHWDFEYETHDFRYHMVMLKQNEN